MLLSNLTPRQLRQAADLKERIDALQDQLNALIGGEPSAPAPIAAKVPKNGRKKRKKLSAEGLANIRAGVAKRMAKRNASVSMVEEPTKRKRKMSPAAKARLSAMAKARWKQAKASGKSKL